MFCLEKVKTMNNNVNNFVINNANLCWTEDDL